MTDENLKQFKDGILEHFDEKTEEIKRHFDVVAEDIKGEIATVSEQVASNTETLEIIKLDIEFIKNELKQKVARDEFAILEKRVSMLEARQK